MVAPGQFAPSEEKELSRSRLEKEAALTGETTLLRNFQPVSDLSDLVLYVIIHSQAQSFWFSQTQMFTIPLAKHILVNVPGQQHPYLCILLHTFAVLFSVLFLYKCLEHDTEN